MLVCAAMSSSASFQVEHDKANREFFIKFGKDKAVLQYEVIDPKTLDFVHTEVPESLRGKGIAKHLAKAALEYVAGKDLQAKITCPYVGKFAQTDAAKAAFDYLVSEDLRATLSCTYLVKYWNEAQNPEYRRRVVT
ncbi:protein NATD1 isoform X1 [Amblyomma americanum]